MWHGMVIECDEVKKGKSQIFTVIFLFCQESGLSLRGRGWGFPLQLSGEIRRKIVLKEIRGCFFPGLYMYLL